MAEGGESDTFVQDLQDVRRATRDTRAISALLDRYAYGTANPTERFTPEAEQEPKGFLERFKDSTQGGITIPGIRICLRATLWSAAIRLMTLIWQP